LPELDQLAAEMAGTPVRFLAVSLDADTRRVRVAVETLKLTLPIATAESELLAPLNLETVPATIFLNASGEVVASLGISTKAQFKQQAMRLLAPAATASTQAAVTR
jgi:hypothetical protein